VRREVALYLPVVAALDPTLNESAWLARIRALAAERDYDAISAMIPDEILDKFAFAGNPTDIIGQIERLIDAGASRIEFGTPHGLDSERGIQLLGEKVLPHFRK
jgi:5,10-methylenetetrahydromethanopterin reductase